MTTHWKLYSLIVVSACSLPVFCADLKIPELSYEYGAVKDNSCEKMTQQGLDFAIKPGLDHHTQIMKEANSLTPLLQQQWNTEGKKLLTALLSLVGRNYSRNEIIVYTTACDSGGMSTPFTVGIGSHLKSIKRKPTPLSDNVTLTFHEFIHRYLVDSFDYSKSEVLKEFQNSPAIFKNHLHLMALMERSMEHAGLQNLIQPYENSIERSKPYRRAWKIATSKKYQDRLIKETKEFKGSNENYWFFDPKLKSP
ncbi:hypothetical protein SAMN02745866_00699 [Alteromonadaceae bacterium Bs31]|nr:hypothetical protein SAMN02745866_00699 [Alteromonadaceae bacterium Bs31]